MDVLGKGIKKEEGRGEKKGRKDAKGILIGRRQQRESVKEGKGTEEEGITTLCCKKGR